MSPYKYCFVAYTGSESSVNVSRWYVVSAHTKWRVLRHDLETFSAQIMESMTLGHPYSTENTRPAYNTFLKAYTWTHVMRPVRTPADLAHVAALRDAVPPVKGLVEVLSDDNIQPNTFILLVRHPMPLGARAFVPLERQDRFLLLQEKIEELSSLAWNGRGDDKTDVHLAHAKEEDKRIVEASKRRWHASERPVEHIVHTASGLTVTTPWSRATEDYKCPNCSQTGVHYADACNVFEREPKQIYKPAYGADRFGTMTQTSASDVKTMNAMYRSAQRSAQRSALK